MKSHIVNDQNMTSNLREITDNNKLMESIFTNIGEDDKAGLNVIFSSLTLPDREFAFVSEQILNECEKSINNVNDKLSLIQTLNVNGLKVEDLNQSFIVLCKQIEETFAGKISEQKIDFLKRYVGILANAINDTEGIAKRIVSVPIQLCHPDAQRPVYAKAGDAGMDLYAVEDITINPGETVIIPTGIKVALPLGYEFEVRPRSGMSVKTPLRVANAPGTIDSGYRDEIGVIITNIEPRIKDVSFDENGSVNSKGILWGQSYTITKGMRFAQLVLKEVPTCVFYDVEDVKTIGFDRIGGFGSSGVR